MAPGRQRTPAAGSLALVGFMGAGKSCVGMAVASRLRIAFADTDELIVERLGPIDRIFAEHGEEYFRSAEREVVLAALSNACELPCVLSLGGGAVTSADVRSALGGLQHVVWLEAPPEVLFARAAGGGRPLATDEGRFRRLLDERVPLYAEVATVRVSNDGSRPLSDVVDDVIDGCVAEGRSG